jgi:hypothetical protein
MTQRLDLTRESNPKFDHDGYEFKKFMLEFFGETLGRSFINLMERNLIGGKHLKRYQFSNNRNAARTMFDSSESIPSESAEPNPNATISFPRDLNNENGKSVAFKKSSKRSIGPTTKSVLPERCASSTNDLSLSATAKTLDSTSSTQPSFPLEFDAVESTNSSLSSLNPDSNPERKVQ